MKPPRYVICWRVPSLLPPQRALVFRRVRKRGFDHVAWLPSATVEPNQSHLSDRTKILGTRVDLDAGQERGGLIVQSRHPIASGSGHVHR
jgi:hypothetical protein